MSKTILRESKYDQGNFSDSENNKEIIRAIS